MKTKPPLTQLGLIAYFVSIPTLFLTVGYLFKIVGVEVTSIPTLLPGARVICIVLSIVSILYPWLLKRHNLFGQMRRSRLLMIPQETLPLFYRLIFATMPAVYGLFLFLIGSSLLEFTAFGVCAVAAIILWSVYSFRTDGKA